MLKRSCASMAATAESRVSTSSNGRFLSSAWVARATAWTRLSGRGFVRTTKVVASPGLWAIG
jgi:hypothetical protein